MSKTSVTKINNGVGLEAEFILRGKGGQIIYPGKHGFEVDDFPILGEIRAEYGTSRQETLANFMKAWYETVFKAKSLGFTIDLAGFAEITPKFYTEIIRVMGNKEIAETKNIYPDMDILELSDAVIIDGKIEKHHISTGLHIHFSSNVHNEIIDKTVSAEYSPVKIPISFGGVNQVAEMNLYQKGAERTSENKLIAMVNRITKPVLYSFVEKLDKGLLTKYKKEVRLKYRNPGFFETKPWGFEYRSLPFDVAVLTDIADIVDYSFSLLEDLDI
jgi:hypothetical protein